MLIFANACDLATAGKATSKYMAALQKKDIIIIPLVEFSDGYTEPGMSLT